MLGPSLLVAPVFSPDGAVRYYLPRGRWTNFFTDHVVEGPRWMEETHGYQSVPLWVRPGTLLALGGNGAKPDYDYTGDVVLHAYEIPEGEGTVAVVPSVGGTPETRFELKREGRKFTAGKKGAAKGWKLLLIGEKAASVKGRKVEAHPHGTLIAAGDGDSLTFTLE